jgi:quercetin dioxygenase-like cupin family protein
MEMRVIRSDSTAAVPVETEGASRVKIQELITAAQGAPTFAMRLFEVEPGGHTPLHEHSWEHEVFIVAGEGEVRGEQAAAFGTGDAVFVPPGEKHQFVNTGPGVLKFICCIPIEQPCCK